MSDFAQGLRKDFMEVSRSDFAQATESGKMLMERVGK